MTRRRGRPPAEVPAPVALLVMAEHRVGVPVWDRPHGSGDPLSRDELAALGVTPDLVDRLQSWNDEYDREALGESWSVDPAAMDRWAAAGLTLAHDLQTQAPDLEVRYDGADRDVPVRNLRGPD